MLPVLVLVLLASAECRIEPLQKSAARNLRDVKLTDESHPQNRSEGSHVNDALNGDNELAGCTNCGKNPLPNTAEVKKMRMEMIKEQILQALQLTEPPKINRRDINIPPQLLKKFQEERERQRRIEEQPPETKTEVVLLGNRVSLPKRSKWFASTRKVKVEFQVSDKVYVTRVHSATLWIRLSKSRMRFNETILTIKDTNNDKESESPITITKYIRKIRGVWVSVKIKKIVELWKKRELNVDVGKMNQNHTLEISCLNCQDLNEEVLENGNTTSPFIVIDMVSVKARKKRSINCRPGIRSCCLQEMYVSFADMGWDNWILIPEGFNVNYCTGSCYGHILPVYSHSGLLQKVALQKNRKDMAPCCSPTKLAPLSILYFDPYENIFQQNIENMTAQRCGCS